MKSGIVFPFGIIFVTGVFTLEIDQPRNGLAGAYFSNIGTYNFIDTIDEVFLTSYSLTGLENTLETAKQDHKLRFRNETEKLESTLNKIYRACKKNRAYYLPYGTTSIPESQLKIEIDKALSDSAVILSDIISLSTKHYTDKFGIKEKMNVTDPSTSYFYPTNINDFEVAKKYIHFTFGLELVTDNAAVINVRMKVPVVVKVILHRINYLPTQDPYTKTINVIKDQSISNIAVIKNTQYKYNANKMQGSFFLIKNMEQCELFNETFICDPALTTRVEDYGETCMTGLFKSDCKWEHLNGCRRIREKCIYEDTTASYKEFTYLGDNLFHVLLTRQANYLYECDNGRKEEGKLIFRTEGNGDHHYAGTIEIDENCNLTTAHATIFNRNGVYGIEEIDNEDMIWADVPKIIGIPIWIFAVSVAVVALIILMLLVTWICMCFKSYRAEKANRYDSLNATG